VRKLLPLLSASILTLAIAGTAMAWQNPQLVSDCASDENSYAWWVTLPGSEPNYNFDWSFSSNFSNATTVNAGGTAPFYFETPRGGSTLYVRWSSDHGAKTSALADGELCVKPTPTPTPEQPTPTPTPEGSAAGGTGTPAPSIPDTAAGVSGATGTLATLGFGLILVVSLGALAFANVRGARR
jgi:hypothetical protein